MFSYNDICTSIYKGGRIGEHAARPSPRIKLREVVDSPLGDTRIQETPETSVCQISGKILISEEREKNLIGLARIVIKKKKREKKEIFNLCKVQLKRSTGREYLGENFLLKTIFLNNISFSFFQLMIFCFKNLNHRKTLVSFKSCSNGCSDPIQRYLHVHTYSSRLSMRGGCSLSKTINTSSQHLIVSKHNKIDEFIAALLLRGSMMINKIVMRNAWVHWIQSIVL